MGHEAAPKGKGDKRVNPRPTGTARVGKDSANGTGSDSSRKAKII